MVLGRTSAGWCPSLDWITRFIHTCQVEGTVAGGWRFNQPGARSRMGGDPPEIVISPQLSQLGLMEFDQADMAIEEGRATVQRMRPALEQLLSGI
jgi:hypothetical protein